MSSQQCCSCVTQVFPRKTACCFGEDRSAGITAKSKPEIMENSESDIPWIGELPLFPRYSQTEVSLCMPVHLNAFWQCHKSPFVACLLRPCSHIWMKLSHPEPQAASSQPRRLCVCDAFLKYFHSLLRYSVWNRAAQYTNQQRKGKNMLWCSSLFCWFCKIV